MRIMRAGAVLLPLLIGVVAAVAVVLAGGGGTFRVDVPLATLLVSAGAVLSLVLAAFPLIRRRRARQARERDEAYRQGRDAAEAAERDAHRRFLARLDHELKNPVTAIRTALAVEPGDESSANLTVAAAQADRLAVLVGELRALSSLEARDLDREPVDVAAIVREEAGALVDELAARGAHRDVAVELPTAPWPLPTVSGDPDLLAVAVRNLLVNAAKYSDDGARIEVRGAEDAGAVTIEVADTGWGMPDGEVAQVWDELWRGSHARKVEGSGLGLSLVRIVAEKHGGEVAVRSQAGIGTSVRMTLPTR